MIFIFIYRLQISTRTWKKDAYELIDYDSDELNLDILETQDSGYLYRNHNEIEFYEEQQKGMEQLLQIKKLENNFQLKLNDFSFDENGNVTSQNSTWFLLRKTFLDEKMNDYNLKEGDILRIGRITIKIKKIKFKKNKDNKDDISINTNLNLKEIPKNSNVQKVYEKDEYQKYKICRICYMEEEALDNPLIQPCICSGSMKYIHLDCLKHWLQTSIFIKIEETNDCCLYLYKTPECELCKTKFPDYIGHKGKIYEVLDLKNDFDNYLIVESITLDKNQNKYLYIVNLDQPNNVINIGRGHDCHLLLSDISVSRWHCFLTIDKTARKIFIHDNNSKFGTLILVQTKNIIMCLSLKLCIQIGRTYIELLLKEPSVLFDCCGVGEKNNADFFYIQNKETGFIGNKLTIKNDNDTEYSKKGKVKKEEEKIQTLNDNLITRPNLIDGENEEKFSQSKLNENKEEGEKKNNNIIDDIEKLIYEKEENRNNVDKNQKNIKEEILNKDELNNQNEIEKNNESINLLEMNNNLE